MPAVIILGILFMWFVMDMYEIVKRNDHAFTRKELEQMNKEMCGKSKNECAKILEEHR